MKKVIGIVLILIIMLVTLTGCTSESNADTEDLFVEVSYESYFKVIYHKETKVMYAMSYAGRAWGILTLLVDADGKPLLYEGE